MHIYIYIDEHVLYLNIELFASLFQYRIYIQYPVLFFDLTI